MLKYKYGVLFPLAVIEGPIITVIAGFLVSTGQMNFLLAFLVITSGDTLGDIIYFAIGRSGNGKTLHKYGKYFGITMEHVHAMEKHFQNHAKKTLFVGKFSHGVGSLVWVAAGLSKKVRYGVFVVINLLSSSTKALALLVVGYYFGKSYLAHDTLVDYISIAVLVLIVSGYIVSIKTNFFGKLFGMEK